MAGQPDFSVDPIKAMTVWANEMQAEMQRVHIRQLQELSQPLPSGNRNLDALMRGMDRLLWEYADSEAAAGKCDTCRFCWPLTDEAARDMPDYAGLCAVVQLPDPYFPIRKTATIYGDVSHTRFVVKATHGCPMHEPKAQPETTPDGDDDGDALVGG